VRWAILFGRPNDFTPVCTTELGYMARIEPEFTRRRAKLIGLSVDALESHARWLDDSEETQGAKVNYPIIADSDLNGEALQYAARRGARHIRRPHPSDQPDSPLRLRYRPR
jgi:alkyl hydroperoxide reductase subunit AhpC